jgi:Fe-Mn family superoxide dismutase
MSDVSRRVLLQGAAAPVAASTLMQASTAAGDKHASGAAFDAQQSPVPLPFDPKRLNGVSEESIQSHWENKYGGAVEALNTVRARSPAALTNLTVASNNINWDVVAQRV